MVLVTNMKPEQLSRVDLIRQRTDAENLHDELKNQLGVGRVYDPGSATLPGGGSKRGADVQRVELVCEVCRTGETARADEKRPPPPPSAIGSRKIGRNRPPIARPPLF